MEEAGWRDYLLGDPPVEHFSGEDRLLLSGPSRAGARRVWHQVLTYYLGNYSGGSVDSMAGNMGWFELRLTRQETRDLFDSAKGAPGDPIKLEEGQAAASGDAQRWKATKGWADRGAPTAASGADMRGALPTVLKSWTGRILGALAGAATIAGVFGIVIKKDTPEARLLLALGAWLVVFAVVWAALRDERDLAAAARAWPRLAAYRKQRFRFETTRLRTPLPYALVAWTTVALGVVAFWAAHSRGKSALVDVTSVSWRTMWIVVAVLAALILLIYLIARARSRRLHALYVEEYARRRPSERGPPAADAALHDRREPPFGMLEA
jgi:hypothetical protein